LTDDEFGTIQNQGESDDAKRAVTLTVAQVDGLKSTPANIAGSAPKAVKAAQAKPAPVEVEEDEPAPAPTPKAKKVVAEPVEDTGEPEVRKTAAKADATPAKKSKLADIVSDWDDE
jgi:hypothetical protein